jgi:hypothetical protein
MTDYTKLSDDDLAQQIHEATGLDVPSALRVIKSEDPELGQTWAIRILESRDRHSARMDALTEQRRRIRAYA